MRIFHIFFIPFFLFFFTSSYSPKCNDRVNVQFPFKLQEDQNKRCGCPRFNLTCNIMNKTAITLGSWGEFVVQHIDYSKQVVTLSDQGYCLAKRLLNVNLTSSCLKAAFYDTYHFFNCSSNVSFNYDPVACLSKTNFSVFAIPKIAGNGNDMSSCKLMKTVRVPTLTPGGEAYSNGREINKYIHLVWYKPKCAECEQRGLPNGLKYALIRGGIPALIIASVLAYHIYRRCNGNGNNHTNFEAPAPVPQAPISPVPQAPTSVMGLDQVVIQSYPTTVLGNSGRLAKPEDNTCSICLSQYQAKDILRTIPSCQHYYHADCIDEWLRGNITCPLCRNALMPIPLPPPHATT